MSSRRDEVLQQLLQPSVEALGYTLWGIEFISQGKHSTLRIFIDHEKGILVDDCAAVSHQVSGVLDVEDPIATEYSLEVSSPGMDRPLFTPEQFAFYIGQTASLRLLMAVEKKRKFRATIVSVDGDVLNLRAIDGQELSVDFQNVDKAWLEPAFD